MSKQAEAVIPEPAANPHLVGHLRAETRILEAMTSGRMHHAWLMSGPRGIGKATLAFRFARFLLAHGARPPEGAESLHVPPEHPVFHTVSAGANADLFVLRREEDPKTKRLRAIINAADARKAAHFLSMTAAGGGWRVVIVDAADDMNPAAANAILKTLEEPPANSVFLMVSHSPGRLLPTIRSRCLHLPMRPLSQAQVREALSLIGEGMDSAALERAAALSGGSPGRALKLATSKAAELFSRFADMALAAPPYDRVVTQTICGALGGARNLDDFNLFRDLLGEWITARARQAAAHGHAREAGRWAALSAEAARLLARVESFNLDRGQALAILFSRAEAIAREAMANMS